MRRKTPGAGAEEFLKQFMLEVEIRTTNSVEIRAAFQAEPQKRAELYASQLGVNSPKLQATTTPT